MYQITQCGTFDVENYGDLLFPIILKKALKAILKECDFKLFSPFSKPFPADSNQWVHALAAQQEFQADALIIGGGDILSFSSDITRDYHQNWQEVISPHIACWALPTIRQTSDTPVIWHTVGVPYAFSEEEAMLTRILCQSVDYLSVRDELSRKHLQEAGVEKEIAIVPDSALLLPKLYPISLLEQIGQPLFTRLGLESSRTFIFQISPHFYSLTDLDQIIQFLQLVVHTYQWKCLLLPIGHCHGDGEALSKIHQGFNESCILADHKFNPQEIASLIALSQAFVGVSLHGNLTAYAYGVPHIALNLNGELSKLNGFSQLIQQPQRCVYSMQEAMQCISMLGFYEKTILEELQDQIEAHFVRIMDLIQSKHRLAFPPLYPDLLEGYIRHVYQRRYEQNRWEKEPHGLKANFQAYMRKKIRKLCALLPS